MQSEYVEIKLSHLQTKYSVTMASETVSNNIHGNKEPSIDSTRKLNFIAADQTIIMILTTNAKLKQNSKHIMHNIQLSNSHLFLGPCLCYHHGQGELMVYSNFQETLTS